MAILAGLDGCPTGWVVVTQDTESGQLAWKVAESLGAYLANEPVPAVVAVDIPIGLPASGPRACDKVARALLGPRRSSVFPAPVRPVLDAASQSEASAIGRRIDGRGISCQCWNIVPKIREVDELLRRLPWLQAHVREIHPEVSFAALNGKPLSYPKRIPAGREERRCLLKSVFAAGTIQASITGCRSRGAKPDDVLDALVALWSAGRVYRGVANALPSRADYDPYGLPMQILA